MRVAGRRAGAALVAVAFICSSPASTKAARQHGRWSLRVQRDAFTGAVRCRLSSRDGRVRVLAGAVGFVTPNRDTLDAWYRIGDGPAKPWRDRYPRLIEIGAPIDGSSLDDPTDGVVWLPMEDVLAARLVQVRANVSGRVRTFELGDLDTAREGARGAGCETYADARV